MKGVALLVTSLVAVSPVLGTVMISLAPGADPLTADLVMVCDGDDIDTYGSRIAGVALEVSVDRGVIEDVYNYKTSGESRVGDKGYGIFPSTITFTGDYAVPCEIADTGTPVVPATHAPDNPGGLGTNSIVLEFGALYNQGVPDAAPEATTVLCTIQFSEACGVTLATNKPRGGVVRIGGEPVTPELMGVPGPMECMRESAPEYSRWVRFGRPACWCYRFHCRGDANGKNQGGLFGQPFYPVGTDDLSVLVAAWQVSEANIHSIVSGGISGTSGICADFNHASQGGLFGQPFYPVGTDDLSRLVENWRVPVGDMADCDSAWIHFWLTP